MAIRQVRLEPLALSVFGRERMVNGWAASSGEKRIDFLCRNRMFDVTAKIERPFILIGRS